MTTAGLALMATAALICLPSAVERIRRARVRRRLAAAELARVTAQRDRWMQRSEHYEALYHGEVRTNAALLEHIGDERQAAASQAVADSPAYYDAVAARMAKMIDREWFEMSADEGGAS